MLLLLVVLAPGSVAGAVRFDGTGMVSGLVRLSVGVWMLSDGWAVGAAVSTGTAGGGAGMARGSDGVTTGCGLLEGTGDGVSHDDSDGAVRGAGTGFGAGGASDGDKGASVLMTSTTGMGEVGALLSSCADSVGGRIGLREAIDLVSATGGVAGVAAAVLSA